MPPQVPPTQSGPALPLPLHRSTLLLHLKNTPPVAIPCRVLLALSSSLCWANAGGIFISNLTALLRHWRQWYRTVPSTKGNRIGQWILDKSFIPWEQFPQNRNWINIKLKLGGKWYNIFKSEYCRRRKWASWISKRFDDGKWWLFISQQVFHGHTGRDFPCPSVRKQYTTRGQAWEQLTSAQTVLQNSTNHRKCLSQKTSLLAQCCSFCFIKRTKLQLAHRINQNLLPSLLEPLLKLGLYLWKSNWSINQLHHSADHMLT